MTKAFTFAVTSCVAAMAIGLVSGSAAYAQSVDTGLPDDAQDEAASSGTIIVTGSRIRSSFDQPTPVAIMGDERLEQRGITNVGDALNELRLSDRT